MTGVQVAATYPESVRGWTGLNCATPLYRQLSRACFASESLEQALWFTLGQPFSRPRNGVLGNSSCLVAKCLSNKSAVAFELAIGKRCGVTNYSRFVPVSRDPANPKVPVSHLPIEAAVRYQLAD